MLKAAGRNAGFTLFEILIAISIFAVLATMVYSSLNAVVSKNDAIKGGVEVFAMGKNCLNRISRDLIGAYVTRYPEYEPPGFDNPADPYRFQGEEEYIGSGSFPRLRFASTAHLPMGSAPVVAGLAEIRYYVIKSEEVDDQYILKRADTPFPYDTDPDWEPGDADDPVLCEGIEELTFTYYDDEGNSQTTWDSDADFHKYATPRAVSVEMTVGTKNGAHRFFTRIDLPVYRERLDNVQE